MIIESSRGKKKLYEVDPFDLGPEELERLMQADIVKVFDICSLSNDAAALLLRLMRWKTEPTTEAYMDNPTKLSVAAGLIPARASAKPTSSRGIKLPPPPSEPGSVCQICFDDEPAETRALDCSHAFCTGCWAAYATSKIREEGEHKIACMAEGCAVIALDAFVLSTLSSDPRAASRYKEMYTRGHPLRLPRKRR